MSEKIKEVNHLSSFFYSMPGAFTTMTKQELQETLLATDGWIICGGHVYDLVTKHLGAGIYQVSKKEKYK